MDYKLLPQTAEALKINTGRDSIVEIEIKSSHPVTVGLTTEDVAIRFRTELKLDSSTPIKFILTNGINIRAQVEINSRYNSLIIVNPGKEVAEVHIEFENKGAYGYQPNVPPYKTFPGNTGTSGVTGMGF